MATNNIVVISDLHSGCRLALCPPTVRMDDGGTYRPSKLQRKLYSFWEEFWDEFVPEATKGEPYDVIMNGDGLNGKPHGANTNISDNWSDQSIIARTLMEPVVDKCETYYHIRGTEAHVGKGAEHEETLARELGAKPNDEGQHARYDLWKMIGGTKLIHALHHIGTSGSNAYEATAVHKELVEEFTEAGRWRNTPPDVIVRSHRHRYMRTALPIGHTGKSGKQHTGEAIAVVSPAWQGKTPFVWKIAGARLATPQFGGFVIRYAHDELFVRPKVWTVDRSKTEK